MAQAYRLNSKNHQLGQLKKYQENTARIPIPYENVAEKGFINY